MKRFQPFAILLMAFILSCSPQKPGAEAEETTLPTGTLEVYAALEINPGNVAVSSDGRVFMSVHPMRGGDLQFVEVTDKTNYESFPDASYQTPKGETADFGFDTPLGTIVDSKNRLWVIDAGLAIGRARLFAFDVNSGKELHRFEIPAEIAPSTSFVQDLAIDAENNWAFLADFGDTGIIAVNIEDSTYRKFTDSTMLAEDIDMVIDGKAQNFEGAPARIGINPITLSGDGQWVYYGAMSGTQWYRVSAQALRTGAPDDSVRATISVESPKPISDGVATTVDGKHYFTNIQDGSIDVFADGQLQTLVKDEKIDWPDNVRIGPDNWLYISVNQLHKSPAFTGGEDVSTLPYYILRVKM